MQEVSLYLLILEVGLTDHGLTRKINPKGFFHDIRTICDDKPYIDSF